MAQKVQITLIDDVTGEPAQETVSFGLDGSNYEIDLTTENAVELRASIAKWVKSARRVAATRGGARRGRSVRHSGSNANAVREWARANGYTVSERGRISAEVQRAYDAAN